jgi:hypothetical protein
MELTSANQQRHPKNKPNITICDKKEEVVG